MSDAWLAKQLHPFGIRPRNIRISGTVGRGYFESDFKDAFQRYVPRSAAGPEDRGQKGRLMVGELMVDGGKDQNSEDGGQSSDGNAQKPEVGEETPEGRTADDGKKKSEDGRQRSEGGEEQPSI